METGCFFYLVGFPHFSFSTKFNLYISLFILYKGVCADQAKVCGYHRFQKVDLSEAVVAELRHQFEAKAELLHQTVALHSYTTILSRLQVESYLYLLLSSNPITRNVAVQETSSGKSTED